MRFILEAKCKTKRCRGVLYIRDATAAEVASGQVRQVTPSGVNLLKCEVCGRTSNYLLKDMQLRQSSGRMGP